MKKIFLIAIAILTIETLVGCASTPAKRTPSYGPETTDPAKEKEWFETIHSILEKQELSQDDLDQIAKLPFGNTLSEDRRKTEVNPYNYIPYEIKTTRTDYTGRITNKSDKKVTFMIGNGNCGEYNKDKRYVFDAKPGETVYFVLPYAITEFRLGNRYDQHFLKFYTLPSGDIEGKWEIFYGIYDGKLHDFCIITGDNLDNDALYLPLFNELMKKHSIDITYYSDYKKEVKYIEAFEYSWED